MKPAALSHLRAAAFGYAPSAHAWLLSGALFMGLAEIVGQRAGGADVLDLGVHVTDHVGGSAHQCLRKYLRSHWHTYE